MPCHISASSCHTSLPRSDRSFFMHRLPVHRSLRPGLPRLLHIRNRFYSSNKQSAWKQAATIESPLLVEENFPKHFIYVLDVGKRCIKFSLIGLALVGLTVGTAFEGAHMYVEMNGLAPESDAEVKRWEWESDADKWSGNPLQGGTDPGLGLRARHLVRAAWMAYTWGIGHNIVGTHDQRGTDLIGPAGVKVINPQLQLTEQFLRAAIHIAQASPDKLYPSTLPQLWTLHGNIKEKLGNDFLPDAKLDYEKAWYALNAQGIESARIALKLGDVESRLGSGEQALNWWMRALQLINGQSYENVELVPLQAPTSPLAQRLLSSSLVSLSAFYAKSGQFQKAASIEERALNVLRSIRPPESLATASAPEALHALYLLQRSSIISVHLAQVLCAQKRRPPPASVQWLTFAAESSERVARALTGLPLVKSEEFHAKKTLPHPLEERLLTMYSTSGSMKPVAEGLLRDARRTAAESWNLMGILHENREGPGSKLALECFERAVEWAGTPSSNDGEKGAAEGIPDADWKVIWNHYQRANGVANRMAK